MPCTGSFATAQEFANFWCIQTLDPDDKDMIDLFLDIAASDMHAAMASVGACDCTLAPWAVKLMKKLNIIDAMLIHNCPCKSPNIDTDTKRMWLKWLSDQLGFIMENKIELCAGHTAKAYPSITWAQQGGTFNDAKIIINTARRNS